MRVAGLGALLIFLFIRRAIGVSPHPQPLSQNGRGEKTLTPSPLPAREGSNPHPRPLSQNGRGEKTLTPSPLPAGEGSNPHPQPLSQRERGV